MLYPAELHAPEITASYSKQAKGDRGSEADSIADIFGSHLSPTIGLLPRGRSIGGDCGSALYGRSFVRRLS